MEFAPDIHHRRSIRLTGYDYSQEGLYFVTICTNNHQCLFGEIINGVMKLNDVGKIVLEQLNAIPQRFAHIDVDEYIVMPNHIHTIITVGAPLAGAQYQTSGAQNQTAGVDINNMATAKERATARVAPTVGEVVGAYKSLCVHHCLKWISKNEPGRIMGKIWQRNYYEHIVRNDEDLNRIREYINNNPGQWEMDKLHPRNKK